MGCGLWAVGCGLAGYLHAAFKVERFDHDERGHVLLHQVAAAAAVECCKSAATAPTLTAIGLRSLSGALRLTVRDHTRPRRPADAAAEPQRSAQAQRGVPSAREEAAYAITFDASRFVMCEPMPCGRQALWLSERPYEPIECLVNHALNYDCGGLP